MVINLLHNKVLGRIGSLDVRLANDLCEVKAAQSLRYKIFAKEMGAKLAPPAMAEQRDFDKFDECCEHFLLIDTKLAGPVSMQIVGTYRLMRQSGAKACGGFYSQNEYDIANLIKRYPNKNFVELGRSCILPEYRTRRSIELLWQGIWFYIRRNQIDIMFGCASFPGTKPILHAQALSFLFHNARTDEAFAVQAQKHTSHLMDLMPVEAIVPRKALKEMPPLIKGYLRLGAMVSDKAVIDYAFNTTDVLIILPIFRINRRYINYYGSDADRFAP